ncbi:g3589 [Coccomyxa viridis]|uniref:G3589 protein n=1 Tax=Coccomyxa viridis TaxID=1274662 RepID=A0ABP1FRJ7_9CHLO
MTHVRTLEGHAADVLCCAFHTIDPILASGAEDGTLLLHDLRTRTTSARIEFDADELPSIAFAASDPNIIYASGGTTTYSADLRQAAVLQSRSFNSDEVNSISVSPNGRFLAAADDAGDVKIIDASTWQLFKSMRGAHDNICSSGVFRPHHPWELLTGSLDASVKRWNFSQGRSVRHWRMEPTEEHNSSQAFNPPLVHSVAVACAHWARQLGRLVAVARGDGLVAVYDADQPQQAPQHRKVTKRGKQTRPNGPCQVSRAEEPRRADPSGLVSALGADSGGHRSSVGCVRFHKASHGRLLLSGGNDARVLLWAWADRAADPQWQDVISQSTVEDASAPVAIDNDGRNINCVDSMDAAGFNTVIADTSPIIKLHNVL